MEKNKFRPVILIFGILTFFIFIISFAVFYTTENFSSTCGCKLPLWVIIVSISSLGLFVGSATYYILSNSFIKEKKEIEANLLKFLDVLDEDDKRVLICLIENKGEISQSKLTKILGSNKVKTSRIVARMEEKGLIKKEKSGMTNKLILNDELKELFVK